MTTTSDTENDEHTLECAGCGDSIDPLLDTHYRVGEEERPVAQLEKATEDLEIDDWFSRNWFVCPGCITEILDLENRGGA